MAPVHDAAALATASTMKMYAPWRHGLPLIRSLISRRLQHRAPGSPTRNNVAAPTPARRAMASMLMSGPCSAKASRSRCRLRSWSFLGPLRGGAGPHPGVAVGLPVAVHRAAGADSPVVFAGFVVTNSETGCGACIVPLRLVAQVCANGMTFTRDAMRAVHLGEG